MVAVDPPNGLILSVSGCIHLLSDEQGLAADIEARMAALWTMVRLSFGGTPKAAHALARYAALCQEAGLVPIVEPEVLMEGDHSLARCAVITEETLHVVFVQLRLQGVLLEGMLLKPNMVLPGQDCPKQESVDEVADATVSCLRRTVPAAVPGVAFLSGGQSAQLASARLNAMNARAGSRLPWALAWATTDVDGAERARDQKQHRRNKNAPTPTYGGYVLART